MLSKKNQFFDITTKIKEHMDNSICPFKKKNFIRID